MISSEHKNLIKRNLWASMLKGKSLRRYIILAFVAIIYFILAALVVKNYGPVLIPVVWSFPLLVFTIIFFYPRTEDKLCSETKYINRFLVAYVALLLSLAATLVAIKYVKRRCFALIVAFTTWLFLSLVYIKSINHVHRSGVSRSNGVPAALVK
jgi:hypothetical protein